MVKSQLLHGSLHDMQDSDCFPDEIASSSFEIALFVQVLVDFGVPHQLGLGELAVRLLEVAVSGAQVPGLIAKGQGLFLLHG